MMDVATLEKRLEGFFPALLGIRFREAAPERVRAGLAVRDDLCTMPGILHGGAIMAFADTLGAAGELVDVPDVKKGTFASPAIARARLACAFGAAAATLVKASVSTLLSSAAAQ